MNFDSAQDAEVSKQIVAEGSDPECGIGVEPVGVDPAGFYPEPIARLLASKEWAAHGLLPIVEPLELVKSPPPKIAAIALPAYPLPGVAKVSVQIGTKTTLGSAFLIFSNPYVQVLLTAGHVLGNATASDVKVFLPGLAGHPGLHEGLYQANVTQVVAYPGWQDPDMDFGAIWITGASSFNNIIQPMAITNYALLKNHYANISGYLATHYAPTTGTGAFNPLLNSGGNVVGCSIIGYPGQSGSPIWVSINGHCYAAGVQGSTAAGLSYGAMLDQKICDILQTWLGVNPPVYTPQQP